MGTKNNPAPYDCYANAEPDEPMFVLLARDRVAADVVRLWVTLRAAMAAGRTDDVDLAWIDEKLREVMAEVAIDYPDVAQLTEAIECANAMEAWRAEHRP